MSGIQDSAVEALIHGISIHSFILYLKLDNARTTSGDGLLGLADDSSGDRSRAHGSSGSRARRPSADADSQTPAHGKGSPTGNLRMTDSQRRRCCHYRTTNSLLQWPARHRSRCSCSHSHLQHRRHGKHNARPLCLAAATLLFPLTGLTSRSREFPKSLRPKSLCLALEAWSSSSCCRTGFSRPSVPLELSFDL
ncbi:hypothetical protein Mapa_002091 [Marchantia paleacea]|nr:hypothetical protein Mapa_002091 [Marchantia paleacea]